MNVGTPDIGANQDEAHVVNHLGLTRLFHLPTRPTDTDISGIKSRTGNYFVQKRGKELLSYYAEKWGKLFGT